MLEKMPQHILALTGGVGGAKLALGLSKIVPADQLTLVANTADDFKHLGLSISPDLDTVMYTLAEINDRERGWGLAGESWNMMDTLKKLGGESWFQLGDRDLATHLLRSQRLSMGHSLSEVTADLCRQLGVRVRLLPMTDDTVSTKVVTGSQTLDFQHYFVREQCRPVVTGIYFDGIEKARPQPQLMQLLQDDQLTAIIICPSNPLVSVQPILQLPGVRQAMQQSCAPVIAVSPIVAGSALKGPAAKMLNELNIPSSASSVAEFYGELLDGFVIDHADSALQTSIQHASLKVHTTNTVMHTLQQRIDLAKEVLMVARASN